MILLLNNVKFNVCQILVLSEIYLIISQYFQHSSVCIVNSLQGVLRLSANQSIFLSPETLKSARMIGKILVLLIVVAANSNQKTNRISGKTMQKAMV